MWVKIGMWILSRLPLDAIGIWLAKQLTGVTDDIIRRIFIYIKEAEVSLEGKSGEEKKQYVINRIEQDAIELANWVINFLIELGVAYLKRKLI